VSKNTTDELVGYVDGMTTWIQATNPWRDEPDESNRVKNAIIARLRAADAYEERIKELQEQLDATKRK
jgi:hypothetical protein